MLKREGKGGCRIGSPSLRRSLGILEDEGSLTACPASRPSGEGAKVPSSRTPEEEVNPQTLPLSVHRVKQLQRLRGSTLRRVVGAGLEKQSLLKPGEGHTDVQKRPEEVKAG